MTSYTFTPTGRPMLTGDYRLLGDGGFDRCIDDDEAATWNANGLPAYRRIDAPADSRLLEVATALAAGTCASSPDAIFEPESVTTASVALARALIAACEGESK